MKKTAWLLWLGLALGFMPALQAAPLVELTSPSLNLPLAPYVDILEDSERKLAITDVTSERYAFRFASAPLSELFFGYTTSVYWMRFTVDNQRETDMHLVLEVMPADIDYLDLYEIDPVTKTLQASRRMGSAVPYAQREYDHPLYFFDLALTPKKALTYYLRVESNKTINLQLNLSTPREHLQNTTRQDRRQGLLVGALVLLSLLHGGLYLAFRFKGFLWCSLFLFSVVLIQTSWNGYWLPFFTPHDLLLDRQIIAPVYIAILFSSLFVQSILETRKHSPWQHNLLNAFVVFALLASSITWFITSSTNSLVASVFALCNTITIFGITLQANMAGHTLARHFLIVRTMTTAIILIAIFNIHGYLPQGSFTNWGVSAAVAVESAIMLLVMVAACLQDQKKQIQKASSFSEKQVHTRPLINLADICHELRTPISGILGMSDLLMDGNLTEQQQNQVKTLRKSGQALLDVTNKIADLSSIERGTVELSLATFELTHLIESCVENCRNRAESSNIELIYHVDAHLPAYLKGDQGKLQQILINILHFTLRHLEKGEVILNVSPGLADDIVFSIRSGSNTLIDRSLSTETRKLAASDQLNITIAEQYLQLMGSFLSLQTHIGEGVSIEFHVALEAQTAPVTQETNNILLGKRMLVVDDNATCCAIIEQQAIQWGMSVTSAHGGKEALAILRSGTTLTEPFDIVLTDYDMPGMNGMELATNIREDRKINSAQLLIIMLTGVSTAPSKMMTGTDNIQNILYKPLSGKSLRQALQSALTSHSQHST